MRAVEVSKRLSRALFSFSSYSRSLPNFLPSPDCHRSSGDRDTCLLRFPWSATQQRAVKVNASHVRPGNVIEKSGKMYQVIDAEHKQRGRGGAMMQMELRDIDTGNKVSLRFGTEEAVERTPAADENYICIQTLVHLVKNGTIILNKPAAPIIFMPLASLRILGYLLRTNLSHVYIQKMILLFVIESETFEQLEVPLDVFGKAGAYLQEGMKVWLQLYDGRALSGSIPKRVACTIKEIHASTKGPTVTPRYRRALLDNGVTVMVPSYLEIGEEIFINPQDDSYIGRAK